MLENPAVNSDEDDDETLDELETRYEPNRRLVVLRGGQLVEVTSRPVMETR